MRLTIDEAYRTLGLESGASEAAVKTAYKKLALRTHPDKNPNDSEAHKKFLQVSEAYKRITDPSSFHDDDDDIDEEVAEEEMEAMFYMMFSEMFGKFGVSGEGGGISASMLDMVETMMMSGEFDDFDDDYGYDDSENDEDDDIRYEGMSDRHRMAAAAAMMGGGGPMFFLSKGDQHGEYFNDDVDDDDDEYDEEGEEDEEDEEDELGDFSEEDMAALMMHELLNGASAGGGAITLEDLMDSMARGTRKSPAFASSGANGKKAAIKMSKKNDHEDDDEDCWETEDEDENEDENGSDDDDEDGEHNEKGDGNGKRNDVKIGDGSGAAVPVALQDREISSESRPKETSKDRQRKAPPLGKKKADSDEIEDQLMIEFMNSMSMGFAKGTENSSKEQFSRPTKGAYDPKPATKMTGKKGTTNAENGKSDNNSGALKASGVDVRVGVAPQSHPSEAELPSVKNSQREVTQENIEAKKNGKASKAEEVAHGDKAGRPTGISSSAEVLLNVGSRVRILEKHAGTVAYYGDVHYAKGPFVGVVLDDSGVGKNNGKL
jgi:curved DNA-binding protein CbpA